MLNKPTVFIEINNPDDWLKVLPDAESFVTDIFIKAWMFALSEGVIVPNGRPEVTIFLTNDDEIRNINREYRKVDRPTNVLSFPAIEEGINFTDDMTYLAGDIFISIETTLNEAEKENKPFTSHVAHLLIHSCLHLLGFDHETDEQAEQMEPLEVKFLSTMGIKNPYENF